jgi:hypothetical protein
MEQLLKEFANISSRKYCGLNGVPSYSYAAGVYESLLKSMFEKLEERDQKFYEDLIKSITANLIKE